MPSFHPDVVKRLCSLPPASGVGARTIEECGHPTQKYLPPSDHCIACITSSMRGGIAVEKGTVANATSDIKPRSQQ